MTKRHLALGVGLLVVLVGGVVAWRSWAQWRAIELPAVGAGEALDPDRPMVMNVERGRPSPSTTLGDLVRDADAVLVVQLFTDVTQRKVGPWPGGLRASQAQSPMQRLAAPAPPPFYYTIYSFYVHEAIKGAMGHGDVVRVARKGGRQTYEDDFPRPGVGEKFVVFLKWSSEVGAYTHLLGPTTTFRTVNGRVHPLGRAFDSQLGRSEDEFIRELTTLAEQQRR